MRSIRSLSAPVRRSASFRSAIVGSASAAKPRAWVRKGPSSFATGFARVHQRVHVVERGPQVHEGGVGAPHERRQLLDRLRQRGLLAAERAGGLVQVADEARQVVAALGQGAHELGAVDEEALEDRRVLGQLAEQAAGGRQRGVQVVEALAGLVAAARELARLALEEALERLARLRVERVEDLVEVDRGVGLVDADLAAVGDLLVAGAVREGQVDVAVGEPGLGELPDRRPRAERQRRVVLLDREGDLGLRVRA